MLNPKKDNLAYGFLKPEYPFKLQIDRGQIIYATLQQILMHKDQEKNRRPIGIRKCFVGLKFILRWVIATLYCKSVTCLMYSIIWKYLQKELTVTYWYKCPDFFYNFISQIFGKLTIYIAEISKLTLIHKLDQHWSQSLHVLYLFILTSSNLIHMRLKAILICSRRPVIVTILSGHEASDMFIFAPLYKKTSYKHYSNGQGDEICK